MLKIIRHHLFIEIDMKLNRIKDFFQEILSFMQQALMMTIVNLAQNFVGSNNVNILQPLGQFGTRINGGKDAASPRYIFTMLR